MADRYIVLCGRGRDLAIENAYTLECCFTPVNDRRTIKSFREQLATKLLCQHSSRQHGGRQSQALLLNRLRGLRNAIS